MKLYFFIITVLVLTSCIKDKPQDPVKTEISASDNTVFIVNEGNFGWGYGTISLYDPASGTVAENFYSQKNSGVTLGNVCQSMTKYSNNYYIVINNSNKITVVNAYNFVKITDINGLNSPRYILPVAYNKAYVTDLYSNKIHIINLASNSVVGNIPCAGSTEEMQLIYNKAFITNSASNYCYVVNTINDVIIDSVLVGKGASSIVTDKDAKIWVLATGSSSSGQSAQLTCINPVSLQIEQSFMFSAGQSPSQLRCNKTHDTLYYLNNGVCQLSINASSLPSNPLINQGSKVFYGLGINPKDYTIYVSDAIDYVQRSKIEIYKPNGSFVSSFNAGIISNSFVFE